VTPGAVPPRVILRRPASSLWTVALVPSSFWILPLWATVRSNSAHRPHIRAPRCLLCRSPSTSATTELMSPPRRWSATRVSHHPYLLAQHSDHNFLELSLPTAPLGGHRWPPIGRVATRAVLHPVARPHGRWLGCTRRPTSPYGWRVSWATSTIGPQVLGRIWPCTVHVFSQFSNSFFLFKFQEIHLSFENP
jgi:hypothetical protein